MRRPKAKVCFWAVVALVNGAEATAAVFAGHIPYFQGLGFAGSLVALDSALRRMGRIEQEARRG